MTKRKLIIISIFILLTLPILYVGRWMVQGLNEIDQKFEFMPTVVNLSDLKNEKTRNYEFLSCMYSDSYYPEVLVDKCRTILIELCFRIENYKPENLNELYELTHGSTIELNRMEAVFNYHDSEIETVARECFAENFAFIANTYGCDADIEELIAPRTW